jgi:predicted NBD/HSP70 family sugar kinase
VSDATLGRVSSRGNNLDQVRRRNLSLVLSLVHAKRGMSRAELTRATSLNRSTIAALVAELVELGLVFEGAPDPTNLVGRPSATVLPSPSTVAITVHPELDAVVVGLVALGGTVVRRIRYDTVRVPTAQEVVNIVSAIVEGMRGELTTAFHTVGIGLAIPGLVRTDDGVVSIAPHLGWRDEPVALMLEEATGYAVVSANDATIGAVAESIFGAGRGVNEMIYLNGGASGIGGGVVMGGALLGGAVGFAGELGHTLVNSAGGECHCGASGCLETEVSRDPLLEACGLGAAQAAELDDVLAARYADSPAVRELVDRQISFLGIALRNAINMFNPELIVLGGFLGSLYRAAPRELEAAAFANAIRGSREGVRIERAELGADILTVGAAELVFAPLLADPTTSPRSAVV